MSALFHLVLQFLFLVLLAAFFIVALCGGHRGGPVRVHRKTPKEDALHDQIQQAMNWSPDHFYQREDGRWFNARGVEGECVSLSELFEKRKLVKRKELEGMSRKIFASAILIVGVAPVVCPYLSFFGHTFPWMTPDIIAMSILSAIVGVGLFSMIWGPL